MNVHENLVSSEPKLYFTESKPKLKLQKVILSLKEFSLSVQGIGMEVVFFALACGYKNFLFLLEQLQVECTAGFMREQRVPLLPILQVSLHLGWFSCVCRWPLLNQPQQPMKHVVFLVSLQVPGPSY